MNYTHITRTCDLIKFHNMVKSLLGKSESRVW